MVPEMQMSVAHMISDSSLDTTGSASCAGMLDAALVVSLSSFPRPPVAWLGEIRGT